MRIELILSRSQREVQATTLRSPLAGGIGFEPMHVGIKIRCLNQLGEPPVDWRTARDSNPEPLVLETRTLPIELAIHFWS